MNIAIIGYGIEGQAAYQHWRDGNQLTICDRDESVELPDGVARQLGENYLQGLDNFELIVRSPNVHPKDLIAANSAEIVSKITSNSNEFFKLCPTKNVIGVTGTKGKGTTSSLIVKMLQATGKTVHLGGNIGVAPLELLRSDIQPEHWVVLELSSFQLIDLQTSPPIAVCLMVVPEHLDWHADFAEYVAAKSQLFAHQKPGDIAIYYSDNDASYQIAQAGSGLKIPYCDPPGAIQENGVFSIAGQDICRTDELKLLGAHNWQNVCAAITVVWQVSPDAAAIKSVLNSFTGLPHRLEFVREVNGRRFYNDSFASSLNATEAATLAIAGKKVVIVGGYDRMIPLEHFGVFANTEADQFRTLLVIGQSAERLATMLDQAGFKNYTVDKTAQTMPDIVAKALELSQPGDAVVLSPGFASFDMFKNFEDRGLQFKATVEQL